MEQVLVPLMERRTEDVAIRAWVTACSTGEEAFTLAMLLTETAEKVGKEFDIKVFATDTAERSLRHARTGIYPGGIESEISPERLERFFTREEANYRVSRDLREKVIFAAQNILHDPPFSRLDVCTCRNLLIYLEPETQNRVLSSIHFGLREDGALLLGNSETLGHSEDLYETLDKKHRIFRRVSSQREALAPFPMARISPAAGITPIRPLAATRSGVSAQAQEFFLSRYAPPGVAVDRDGHIAYFQGDTSPFLQPQRGEPTRDLFVLAREHVRIPMRSALQTALATNENATVRHDYEDSKRSRRQLRVDVSPLIPGLAKSPFLAVAFTDQASAIKDDPLPAPAGDAEENDTGETQRLRAELLLTHDQLLTTTQEMRASNEEATSVNEELQSINEELETSKEELQSLNEELTTLNSQLEAKMDELEITSNDLTSLLSSTHIAVLFLDTEFRIRRFTPAVADLMDIIPVDVGRPLSALARKFEDPGLDADVQSVLATLMPSEAEVTSHSHRSYIRRANPYRTRDNRIEGVVITFVEITERKRVEQMLQETERRQRVILEGVKEYAIFTLDTAGRVETWSPAAERVLGFDAVEVVGKDLATVFTAEDQSTNLPGLQLEGARRSGSVAEEHWYQRKSGERFWGSGMLYALTDAAGNATGFINILRDNTDRRMSDELTLEARTTAERSNEAKDHFLANVSHELRTPMSGMLLWSKILLDQPNLDPMLKEGLLAIRSCAEEQQAIVEDLVDTSRIAAGKMRLERAPTNLVATLRSAIDAMRPSAIDRGLDLKETIDPAIGIVYADAHRVHQIVSNLLANAAKFTRSGGKIALRAMRVGEGIVIEVADTGQGMSAELLASIFERFRQGESRAAKEHRGLGLGLAISKQLVELHGGTIGAESAGPGKGSTFRVTLPLRALAPEELKSNQSPVPFDLKTDLKGLKLIVVEDSPETLNALKVLLTDAGAQVRTATNAKEALAKFAAEPPDLLVSDLGLPVDDGNMLLARVRQWEHAHSVPAVPAIAITAYADERNRIQALKSGFRQCLTKPVNPAKLVSILSEFVRRDR